MYVEDVEDGKRTYRHIFAQHHLRCLQHTYLLGYLAYTDHHQGRGHPQGQQPSSLIFMSPLYNVS